MIYHINLNQFLEFLCVYVLFLRTIKKVAFLQATSSRAIQSAVFVAVSDVCRGGGGG